MSQLLEQVFALKGFEGHRTKLTQAALLFFALSQTVAGVYNAIQAGDFSAFLQSQQAQNAMLSVIFERGLKFAKEHKIDAPSSVRVDPPAGTQP